MTPTRTPRSLRRALAVGAVAAAVSLVAVTDGPAGAASDADAWGETFCSETVDWLAGALAGAEQLGLQAADPTLTPADGKDLIVEYLQTGVSATRSFGTAMKRAGVPDVTNGARIQAAILAGITGSGAKLAALAKTAKALPTGSANAFERGATRIGNQLGTFSDPFTKGLDRAQQLDKGNELGNLLRTLPACAPLANGSLGS